MSRFRRIGAAGGQIIGDETIAAIVGGTMPVVPLAPGIDPAVLTAGDEAPLFVTLPIAQVGTSRNGRYYDAAMVAEIARQVNQRRPGGNLGHLKEEERSWRYDRPEVIWIGAVVKGDTAYGKGYVPPYATGTRDFLRRAKAAGHAVGTSIYGRWRQGWDTALGALRVQPGGVLESIDFVPPDRAGVQFAGGMALASELHGQPRRPGTTQPSAFRRTPRTH